MLHKCKIDVQYRFGLRKISCKNKIENNSIYVRFVYDNNNNIFTQNVLFF